MFKQLFAVALSALLVFNMATCVPLTEQELEEYGLLKDFENFISHFGHDAVSFLTCMGPSFITHCSKPVLGCLASHTIVGCINAIKCESHDASVCIHHLHEKAATSAPTTTAAKAH